MLFLRQSITNRSDDNKENEAEEKRITNPTKHFTGAFSDEFNRRTRASCVLPVINGSTSFLEMLYVLRCLSEHFVLSNSRKIWINKGHKRNNAACLFVALRLEFELLEIVFAAHFHR
jgi:hypothetical protein